MNFLRIAVPWCGIGKPLWKKFIKLAIFFVFQIFNLKLEPLKGYYNETVVDSIF